jgi:hypothetical protein
MTQMKLIRSWEPLVYDQQMIKESIEKNDGKIILKGILQKADTLNQNGRVYPRDVLAREVNNYQKLIIERRSMGECDHPDESVISLKNVSHLVTEAYMEGNVVYGSIELLNTPSGKILQELVKADVKLGISSRGVGSTKQQGDTLIVQEDFQLICWDAVSDPSTPNAFMLKEGKTVSAEELNMFFTRSDRIDRILNEILSIK